MKSLFLIFCLLLIVGKTHAATVNMAEKPFTATITTLEEIAGDAKNEIDCLEMVNSTDGLSEEEDSDLNDQCLDQAY